MAGPPSISEKLRVFVHACSSCAAFLLSSDLTELRATSASNTEGGDGGGAARILGRAGVEAEVEAAASAD